MAFVARNLDLTQADVTRYLTIAIVALCALLYQGKTGGELVYHHAVGTTHADTTSRQSIVNK